MISLISLCLCYSLHRKHQEGLSLPQCKIMDKFATIDSCRCSSCSAVTLSRVIQSMNMTRDKLLIETTLSQNVDAWHVWHATCCLVLSWKLSEDSILVCCALSAKQWVTTLDWSQKHAVLCASLLPIAKVPFNNLKVCVLKPHSKCCHVALLHCSA